MDKSYTHVELEAAQQYARQELARRHLTDFCSYIDPNQSDAYESKHLRAIAAKLEEVESGKCKRLFITAPPRHWKSSLSAEKFPLWYLSRNPKASVGLFSHSSPLVVQFSKNIRNNINTNPRFLRTWPIGH